MTVLTLFSCDIWNFLSQLLLRPHFGKYVQETAVRYTVRDYLNWCIKVDTLKYHHILLHLVSLVYRNDNYGNVYSYKMKFYVKKYSSNDVRYPVKHVFQINNYYTAIPDKHLKKSENIFDCAGLYY